MRAPVLTREVAEAEINQWLESKKVFPSTIESQKDSIEVLIDAMTMGNLVYGDESKPDAEKQFKHILLHPLGDVTELVYKNRLNDRMLQPFLKGVDPRNSDERLNATIAALTDRARGIIAGLDSIDKKICNAIAIFFF